jgi:hypothetical protein
MDVGVMRDKESGVTSLVSWVVYCCLLCYDGAKAIKTYIYECRCNGRLQTKRFTRLTHTGSVVELEHVYYESMNHGL